MLIIQFLIVPPELLFDKIY